MRTGDCLVVGLFAAAGAWLLVSSGFSTDSLVEVGAPYSSLLYPTKMLAGWVLVLVSLAILLAPRVPRDLPKRLAALVLRPSPRTFAIVVGTWVALAGAFVSVGLFEGRPSDIDDPARLFQARTYMEGRLSVDVPPEFEAVKAYSIHVEQGRAFGKYEPAPSVLFAASWAIFGTPGLANPLLGGLMVVMLFLGLRVETTELRARFAALLLCGSPFVLFMGGSLHSHPLCAASLVGAFWLSMMEKQRGGLRWLAGSGAFLSLALASRPFTTVLVGGVLAAHAVFRCGAAAAPRRAAALVAGALPGVLLLLGYNAALTGDAFVTPFHAYAPDEVPWFGYNDHTPQKGIANTMGLMRVLNLNLFGWPSSLVFLTLLGFAKFRSVDRLAALVVIVLVAGMLPYFWTDYGFGARFYYAATPFLAWLTVRSLGRLDAFLTRVGLPDTGHRAALVTVVLFFGFSATLYVGPLVRLFGNDYGRLRQWPAQEAAAALGPAPSLVLVGIVPVENEGFTSAFLANPPDLAAVARGDVEAPVVFARDLGPESTARLVRAYPGRRLCHMQHPSIVGAVVITTEEDGKEVELVRIPLPSR